MVHMLISQLADRSGVPATTLRYYEDVGLLPAGRTPAGYRSYGEDAVERLGFITAAKRLGLPLEEIAELLQVRADGSCAQVRDSLQPRLAARITEAEQRASELAAFIVTLHRARAHLDALPDRDSRCDPQCGFLTPPSAASREAWRSAPVACTLSGQDMGDRIRGWQELLAGAERLPIPDGVRLSMPASRAAEVAGLAAAEQECCPFFDFRIHFTGRRLELEVRATAEAAGMLAGLFAGGSA
jgi:DNA-binding transcriptional MerR regulator